MLTPQQIIALRDPDTAGLESFLQVQNGLVDLADIQTSSTAYGDERNVAIALLVLHWEYLRRRSGAATQPTGVGDGPSRREFSRSTSTDKPRSLELTSWGMELLEMQQRNILSVRNRMVT